jgi:uncharacterized protein (DUF302 family)
MNMYGYRKQVNASFEEALQRTQEELQKEGFGILTEIDVKTTLNKKLDADYGNYVILGACNPPFAYQALEAYKDIGLLLPCNVIVYEHQGKTFVSAILPTVAMSMVDNEKLQGITAQVERQLKEIDRDQAQLLQWALKGFPEDQVIEENKKLNAARESLKAQRAELETKIKASQDAAVSVPKLEQFVGLMREKLSIVDFETKRMALDMLDVKAWIDGYNVEVTGVIPISGYVIVKPQSRLRS